MSKRLLSTLLALCLVLSLLPGTAWAADSGTCGDNLTWTLTDDGTLTVSGTGAMTDYGFLSTPWYELNDKITTVVIGNGATSIGAFTFYSCVNVTSVTIPDSVISIETYAFAHCNSLTSLTVPDSVTTIERYAFSSSGLTSLTIPDSVTTIEAEAFEGCRSLTSINVASRNPAFSSADGVLFNANQTLLHTYPRGKNDKTYSIPASVTEIGMRAFNSCELVNVTIPDSVTVIGNGAFYYCDSLTSVTIPDSVTSIGTDAFQDCRSLTSVTIPDSVTDIGQSAFSNCYSLTSVDIPSGVRDIRRWTFDDCRSLTSVTIPDSVTSIAESAFKNCSSLTDVYYGGSESQWEQINIDNYDGGNAPLLNATIHYNSSGSNTTDPDTTPTLIPAVKYVYYSETLPSPWRANANSLPGWLSADGNMLYGIPMEAGTYSITLTNGSETQTVTLTVRENGDNSVRGSNSDGYVVVQEFPDIVQEESVWIIDDVQPPAPGEPDIFDRLLDVYLDGRKLKGGKLEDGQQIPDDWEYYARRGSLMTTLLTQTKANNTQGQHTLSVTISKPNNNSVSTTTAVDTVSTNYYVSNYDPQTESYPFSDGEGTRYRDAIRYLVESGVITGFGDGTFRPKAALTRGQACAILARATGNGSASGSASFTDTSGHWAEGAIAWCASKGIVSGYGNGRFGPEEQLTGYAWSKMLFVALGFDAEEYGLVGSNWESNVMSLLREKGLDQGMNNFYPEQTIKREEACQLVYNAFVQKLISVSP